MTLGWHAFAPGLPELSAMDLAWPLAFFVPALALDALLRRLHSQRNLFGYLVLPTFISLFFCSWIGLVSSPASTAESRAAAAVVLEQTHQQALARISEIQSTLAPSKAISDGLNLAPPKTKKADPNIPKPISLPPLPVFSGPTPSTPALAVRTGHDSAETENETFDIAIKAALALIDEQSRASDQEAKAIAASLSARSSPMQVSRSQAKNDIELFMQACSAALIGSALGGHVFGFGLLSTLLFFPRKLLQLIRTLGLRAQVALRPTVAHLLAPSPSDLAELELRVKTYRETQDDDSRTTRLSLDEATAINEAVTLALLDHSSHIDTETSPPYNPPAQAG